MKERETTGLIRNKGKECTLLGSQVKVGDSIPDVPLVDLELNDRKFGLSLGLLIKETCLLARSVIVVSPEGLVRYVQIVPDQGQQPDYEPVLEVVRDILIEA